MTYQNTVGGFDAAAMWRAPYEQASVADMKRTSDKYQDEDDTPLGTRLKKMATATCSTQTVFAVPADTGTALQPPLTFTDARLDNLSKHVDRMGWPEDLRAQVSPNGRSGATRKQLLQELFAAYNGPGGRRHPHASGVDCTVETVWLVDEKGDESRHAVVAHQGGAVMSVLFGDARADVQLLEKMARKTSHCTAAPELRSAFMKGARSAGNDDLKFVLDVVLKTEPVRRFRSPEGYALEERQVQDGYLATIRHPNGKIVKVERYAQPRSDEHLLRHMNKAFSQSRAATGAPHMSWQELQKRWTKSEELPVVAKQEPVDWSADGYLFGPDGRPLSRDELCIEEDTPLLIDTCGMEQEKAADYRCQLRAQMNGLLKAWEQGQLSQRYKEIGVDVVQATSYGRGVRATKDIAAGTLIGLYGGMVFDAEAWEASHPAQEERDLYSNYLLEPQDKGLYIDSRDRLFRNPMGFLNHPSSKAPCNLKTLKCGPMVVGFVTTRDVACGEELTFPYGWHPHFTGTSRRPHDLSGAD